MKITYFGKDSAEDGLNDINCNVSFVFEGFICEVQLEVEENVKENENLNLFLLILCFVNIFSVFALILLLSEKQKNSKE